MASLHTIEEQARIAEITAKNEAGTATPDDFKEFVRIIRQGRLTASAASATSKTKKARADIPSADDLANELENL